MYLNGLYKPMQAVLYLHAKKIESVSSYFRKCLINQVLKMENYYAD